MADLPRALGVAAIALLVVACATAPAASPASIPTEAPATVLASPATTTRPDGSVEPLAPGTPVASADAPVELTHAWATASLTDVSTGEEFSIADHAGDVIIVETMAIWCSNCRAQQHEVQAALARLPADRVVYVVVDVDPNEDAASLAEYRVDNGFDGRYAIAGTRPGASARGRFRRPVPQPAIHADADRGDGWDGDADRVRAQERGRASRVGPGPRGLTWTGSGWPSHWASRAPPVRVYSRSTRASWPTSQPTRRHWPAAVARASWD